MTWRRHFRVIKTVDSTAQQPINDRGGSAITSSRTQSWLGIALQGHPNRIQRYYQFDDMDRDSDINAALDTIADFCTQSEEQSDEPFDVVYSGDPNESEVKIIKQMLARWLRLNDFRSRLWYMFRDTLKNGDAFYLRDPETQEWLWLDHFMVEMVKVDDTMGRTPEEYIIRGLDYNRQAKVGAKVHDPSQYRTPFGSTSVTASRAISAPSAGAAGFSIAGTGVDPRQRGMMGPFSQELSVVEAQFVIHLSLTIGNDVNWPFGPSILEPIFKTFKQKELLEDAILIYRVQRAPERRIFYIDVGSMPPERAKRHIEAIKNDIHQRRIPNRTGTGGCFDLATKVPLLDGRSLSIADLIVERDAGKQNWAYSCNPTTGEIVPGKITWAGITHRNAEVVRLTLDNGETIVCTPDHKFPILGRGKTEAKDINIGVDSLISFNPEPEARKDTKVVARVSVDERIDVGTLTIDGEEEFHNFHTFALEQGVFAFNSILDAAYNPLCLALDTGVPLVDGRTLSLSDLIVEHNAGKQNWVYSCNPITGAFVKGPITWAGLTRSNAPVVTLTLDNGKTLTCTPDHKIPVLGQGFVEAGKLTIEDRLIAYPDEGTVRLATIEDSGAMDVGTLTIDKDEQYHPHHTFATSSGIFVKNSINDDYYFAQCSSLVTNVPLLDGRTLSLRDLIAEFEEGKENWVYSLNLKTHEMEPGKIAWAGVTRKNAEMVRVTLDNGEHLDTTPDHRFILRNGTERQAGQLKAGDSLMPLYLLEGRTGPRQKNAGYRRFVCNATGRTKFVHTHVCPKPLGRDWVVHHVNFDGMNNNPTNLEVMEATAHTDLHRAVGTYSIGKQWNNPAARAKLVEGIKRGYSNEDPAFRAMMAERNSKNGSGTWSNPNSAERALAALQVNSKKCAADRRLKYTDEMFARVLVLFNEGYDSVIKMSRALKNDEVFQSLFAAANDDTKRDRTLSSTKFGVDDTTLNRVVETAGYSSWGDFKTSYRKNHQVVSVEVLSYREDTGDITVESESDSHVFATAAGVYIHNSADGRGSKVETLPGGECLALDTMIPLTDGRTLSLTDIIGEHNDGIQLWAFSCNPKTGEIVPGIINWAGTTRRATQVMRLDFSNGKSVICTPDHHFPLPERGKVEAKDLEIGDSFFAFSNADNEATDCHLVTMTYLDEPMDTGTITIDGLEIYHNHHTFAIAAGVFTFNSTGEVGDLTYFSKKLARGLRVPTSYLNIGEDDGGGGMSYNDGKLGAAMIQEYRFTKYCMRLQSLLAPKFDREFKRYLMKNGIEIEASLFELRFNPPQSFTRYRQIELDAQRVQVYQGVAENKKLSERFKLQRFMGLSEDEIIENEKLWSEENADKMKKKTGASPAEAAMGDGLGAVGIHPEGDMGGMPDDMPMEEPPADAAAEGAMPAGAAGGPPGPAGGPPAAPPPPA